MQKKKKSMDWWEQLVWSYSSLERKVQDGYVLYNTWPIKIWVAQKEKGLIVENFVVFKESIPPFAFVIERANKLWSLYKNDCKESFANECIHFARLDEKY